MDSKLDWKRGEGNSGTLVENGQRKRLSDNIAHAPEILLVTNKLERLETIC
jgi:hypothetical protein